MYKQLTEPKNIAKILLTVVALLLVALTLQDTFSSYVDPDPADYEYADLLNYNGEREVETNLAEATDPSETSEAVEDQSDNAQYVDIVAVSGVVEISTAAEFVSAWNNLSVERIVLNHTETLIITEPLDSLERFLEIETSVDSPPRLALHVDHPTGVHVGNGGHLIFGENVYSYRFHVENEGSIIISANSHADFTGGLTNWESGHILNQGSLVVDSGFNFGTVINHAPGSTSVRSIFAPINQGQFLSGLSVVGGEFSTGESERVLADGTHSLGIVADVPHGYVFDSWTVETFGSPLNWSIDDLYSAETFFEVSFVNDGHLGSAIITANYFPTDGYAQLAITPTHVSLGTGSLTDPATIEMPVTVGGTARGEIILDTTDLPEGITVEADPNTNEIIVTALRPGGDQSAAIEGVFDVVVTRQGNVEILSIELNLLPLSFSVATWDELEAAVAVAATDDRLTVIEMTADIDSETTLMIADGRHIALLGEYTLDRGLAGHETADGHVIRIENATFILGDNGTGPTLTGGNGLPLPLEEVLAVDPALVGVFGGGVFINSGSTFIMNGGQIRDNIASMGGGVYVHSGATFIFNYGIISDNYTHSHGGGLASHPDASTTMNGGIIRYNFAVRLGGGLWRSRPRDGFVLNGGYIYGNHALSQFHVRNANAPADLDIHTIGFHSQRGAFPDNPPGGILMSQTGIQPGYSGSTLYEFLSEPSREGYTFLGWFTAPTGGTEITTSTAFTADTIIHAQWQSDREVDVTLDPASVILGTSQSSDAATISEAVTVGGDATGNITLDTTDLPEGVSAVADQDTVTITGLRPAGDQSAIEGIFDVVVTREGVSEVLTVEVNLAPLRFTASTWEELQAAVENAPSDGRLTSIEMISDINSGDTLTIDDGRNIMLLGEYTLDRGLIGNIVDLEYGNVIIVSTNSTFILGAEGAGPTLTGGHGLPYRGGELIINPPLTGVFGAGVFVDGGGTFIMNGGQISGNIGTNAGGVYANDGSVFILNNGIISNNHAHNHGGGIGIHIDADATMNGGVIRHNTATNFAGGIWRTGVDDGFAINGGYLYGNTTSSLHHVQNAHVSHDLVVDTVTFNPNGGAHPGLQPDVVVHRQTGIQPGYNEPTLYELPPDPTRLGYIFMGWIHLGAEITTSTTFPERATVVASWEAEQGLEMIITPDQLTLGTGSQFDAETVSATATVRGGTGEISLDISALPAGITAEVNQNTGIITVTGLRPAEDEPAIVGNFDIVITRQEESVTLSLGINLVPLEFEIEPLRFEVTTWEELQEAVAAAPTDGRPTIIEMLADIDSDDTLIIEDGRHVVLLGEYILDRGLAGHEIAYGNVVRVENATFILGAGGTGPTLTGGNGLPLPDALAADPLLEGVFGGGVFINSDGRFIMDGGQISGNTASMGGGVYANRGALFTLNAGLISENFSHSHGGGIAIHPDSEVTMNGGSIKHNLAAELAGGMWRAHPFGGFVRTGGYIYGNESLLLFHVRNVNAHPDLAVHTIGFNPQRGTFPGNPAGALLHTQTGIQPDYPSGAAGTTMYQLLPAPVREGYTFIGWFTAATGGTEVTTSTPFTSNAIVHAQWQSDREVDVTLDPASVTLGTGQSLDAAAVTISVSVTGTATGNIMLDTTDLPEGVSAAVNQNTITLTGLRPAGDQPALVGTFDLIVAREGVSETLTVEVNLAPLRFTAATWVELQDTVADAPLDGRLTIIEMISDINSTDTLTIEGGRNIMLLGEYTLDRGLVGNIVDLEAGNVIIINADSTFTLGDEGAGPTLTGGNGLPRPMSVGGTTIMNPPLEGVFGAGVFIDGGGTFIMNGGQISENVGTNAGGVYANGGSVFILNDGIISGNRSHGHGGGVGVHADALVTMNGGIIRYNRAEYFAGGLWRSSVADGFTRNGGYLYGNTLPSRHQVQNTHPPDDSIVGIVSFNPNGGAFPGLQPNMAQTRQTGLQPGYTGYSLYELPPEPTRPGYIFMGWFGPMPGALEITTSTVFPPRAATARWEAEYVPAIMFDPTFITLGTGAVTDDATVDETGIIGGATTGEITLDLSGLPDGVSAVVDQITETITVSGLRPAGNEPAIVGDFDLVVTRDGASESLTVEVNLAPLKFYVATHSELQEAIRFAPEDGRLTVIELTADISNSSSLTISPNRNIKLTGDYTLTRTGNSGSSVTILAGATFVLDGPTLDRSSGSSSGVTIQSDATFIMNSGYILNHAATLSTGGVGSGVLMLNQSTFIMNGGVISSNSASPATGWIGAGGGVFMAGTGVFEKNGGYIFGNHDVRSSNASNFGGTQAINPNYFGFYTITFDLRLGNIDGATEDIQMQTGISPDYSGSTLYQLPDDPSRAGYSFIGWFTTIGGSEVNTSTPFTSNVTVYARWQSAAQDGTAITKSSELATGTEDEPREVELGSTINYSIRVQNNEELTLENIVVEDIIPNHLTINASEIRGYFGTDATTAVPISEISRVSHTVIGQGIEWTISTLDVNEMFTLIIPTTVNPNLTQETTFINTAYIRSINDHEEEIASETTYHIVRPEDSTEPETTEPETTEPGTTEPETTEPGTTEPETTEPTTTELETTEPTTDPTEPPTTEPETTEPGTTEPTTAEPGTTEPGTTEPTTTEPGTTEPTTTEPGTTEPETTEPTTDPTEPPTTEPETTEPTTTEPETTEPTTDPTEPPTTEPGTTEPTTTEPETTEPTTDPTEPPTTEPGTTEPTTTEPETTEPTTDPTEPPTTEPETTEPGTTEPATTEPGTTEPGTTEPGTTEPATTEPGTTEPTTTEPETTEPGTTEPGTTEPGTTEPGTTEPTTTEPGTTEPETTEPTTDPTEPETTEPTTDPTEPETTEPTTDPTEPPTTEPETTEPTTDPTEPPTTEPETTEPTTTEPGTTEPTTTEPGTTEPTTTEPETTEPGTTEPTTTEPETTEPETTEPTTDPTEPPTTEPETTEPTTTEPGTTEPETTEPTTTEPETTEPTTTEPETTEPATTEPTTTEPETTEPETTEPATTEPTTDPTEPLTTEPATAEPTTDPAEPPTTEPATIESATTAPGIVESATTAPGIVESATTAPGIVESATTAPGIVESATTAPGIVESATTAPGSIGSATTAPGSIGPATTEPATLPATCPPCPSGQTCPPCPPAGQPGGPPGGPGDGTGPQPPRPTLPQTGAIAGLSVLGGSGLLTAGLAAASKKKTKKLSAEESLSKKYEDEYNEVFGD